MGLRIGSNDYGHPRPRDEADFPGHRADPVDGIVAGHGALGVGNSWKTNAFPFLQSSLARAAFGNDWHAPYGIAALQACQARSLGALPEIQNADLP